MLTVWEVLLILFCGYAIRVYQDYLKGWWWL